MNEDYPQRGKIAVPNNVISRVITPPSKIEPTIMDFFSTVCFGFAKRVQMTVHSWQLGPEQQRHYLRHTTAVRIVPSVTDGRRE